MNELTAIDENKYKEINEELNDYNNFPKRDEFILPVDLYKEYELGKGKDIDMLLGSNKDEVRYWINEMDYYSILSGKFIYEHGFPILFENNLKRLNDEERKNVDEFMDRLDDKKIWKITEFYNELLFRIPMNKQAELHSNAGGNTYVYHWKYPGEDETIGACHAIELSYVFNNLQEKIYTGNKINPELAKEVQEMWINFAKYGDPSTSKHKWEQYNSQTRKTMILDEKIYMEEDYKKEQRLLIEPLLKYYFNGCYSNISLNVPQFYKIIVEIVGTLLIIIIILVVIIVLIVKKIKIRRILSKNKRKEEGNKNNNGTNNENIKIKQNEIN
jgi:para-nitrobenzyl esterase